jgi:hypothetical protein
MATQTSWERPPGQIFAFQSTSPLQPNSQSDQVHLISSKRTTRSVDHVGNYGGSNENTSVNIEVALFEMRADGGLCRGVPGRRTGVDGLRGCVDYRYRAARYLKGFDVCESCARDGSMYSGDMCFARCDKYQRPHFG